MPQTLSNPPSMLPILVLALGGTGVVLGLLTTWTCRRNQFFGTGGRREKSCDIVDVTDLDLPVTPQDELEQGKPSAGAPPATDPPPAADPQEQPPVDGPDDPAANRSQKIRRAKNINKSMKRKLPDEGVQGQEDDAAQEEATE